ncbi:PREDICTED: uncharacterized protein LOC106116775 [Papilio xuthus]|uniref:Uncharacterized protein LOC106116775 n=1 Tax=Papilio xuthus TaxID=66420 RepID=A0AAJ6Z6J5_PAPXU|nr:PREDICTED: uncharacterized protein LOC106116775 [Papilio xuthus]
MKLAVIFCMFLAGCNAWMDKPQIYGSQRCVNMWDEGCINGQLPGSGGDDDYLNGGFNPGKRCINMWDEGCINGPLGGSGSDDDYLNGGFTPGKRSLYERLQKLRKSQKHQNV